MRFISFYQIKLVYGHAIPVVPKKETYNKVKSSIKYIENSKFYGATSGKFFKRNLLPMSICHVGLVI